MDAESLDAVRRPNIVDNNKDPAAFEFFGYRVAQLIDRR
jgi:hypothetical protein